MALASIGLLGIVGTGMTILVFIRLIQRQGPLFAGMVTYIIPVIALLWGHVDGEPISGQQILAIAGVLTMVALVQWGAVS
jgi:drug/metabolite transporter (DMT)-like permease